MRVSTLVLALVAYVLSSLGLAFASDWTVNRVSRTANYSTDGSTWTKLTRGMRIPGRSWIVTQRGARVQVSRGRDVVLVTSGTQVFLASTRQTHGKARLTLKKGVVTMKVRKGRKKRVSILTPHVTAVVKGTTLTVGVKGRDSYVSVASGRVGVTSNATGRSVDVTSGQSVTGRSVASGRTGARSNTGSRSANSEAGTDKQPTAKAGKSKSAPAAGGDTPDDGTPGNDESTDDNTADDPDTSEENPDGNGNNDNDNDNDDDDDDDDDD